MKRITTALFLFIASICCMAQVSNNAISFERNGRVSLGIIQDNTVDSDITLQLWLNPQHWIPGANIVTWGNNLNIQLGTPGQMVIKRGGESITVSGLLTGKDIYEQLKDKDLGDELIIPENALRFGEDVFLCNMTVGELSDKLSVKVRPSGSDGYELARAIISET